jgi:hypothetical protein
MILTKQARKPHTTKFRLSYIWNDMDDVIDRRIINNLSMPNRILDKIMTSTREQYYINIYHHITT